MKKIGIIGGGQLGKMMILDGKAAGYAVLHPGSDGALPGAQHRRPSHCRGL